MKKIFITGSTGFVGSNLKNIFINKFIFYPYKKNEVIYPNVDVFIHFAGKAHDLKNYSKSDDYYKSNTELTKKIFNAFLSSDAQIFITLSSVKAVADSINCELTEFYEPNPITHYGKSKLLAEQYILSKKLPDNKRVYILRPTMIHGPGNKGNLSLLYKMVSKGYPWPLGSFENKRSFCSIQNLCFVINELIERNDIPSGVYNISDNDPVSTIELIQLIANIQKKKSIILYIPKTLIFFIAKLGDLFHLPLNTERLQKLTETYLVSNKKLISTLGKELPVTSKEGLSKTFQSFNH
jgi:nucleoside-diphosphate-sugar epimerase